MTGANPSISLRKASLVLGTIITLGSLLWFFIEGVRNLPDLPPIELDSESGVALLLAFLASVALQIAHCGIWLSLVDLLMARKPDRRLVHVFFIAQFAKYVPGNFAHNIGRLILARRIGLSVGYVTAALILELTILVGVGALLGLRLLLTSDVGDVVPVPGSFGKFAILGVFAVVGVAAGPLLLRRFRQALPDSERTIEATKFWLLALSAGLALCMFAAWAFILLIVAGGVLGLDAPPLLFFMGAWAIAWVAGFLMPGAPAGIGIREALLSLLLEAHMPTADAVALAIASRVVAVGADLFTFCIAASREIATGLMGPPKAP